MNYSRLAQVGPGGLLQQVVTKVVTIGRRLGDGFADDGSDAPDVVLFDPAEFPGGWVLGAASPVGRGKVDMAGRVAPNHLHDRAVFDSATASPRLTCCAAP